MSSLEANTYTVKPPVQVGNSITVTKPIIASNLCIRPSSEQTHQFHQQPKKIQPFPKSAAREQHKPKPGASAVFQLKSLHKAAPASVNADYNCEATRKGTTTDAVVASSGTKKPTADKSASQKRILSVQAKTDFSMGNEQNRMQNPSLGAPTDPNLQHAMNSPSSAHINNNIPVPVASLNAQPRMASIITATTEKAPVPPVPAVPQTITSAPRVVSTSSSKTITGGIPISGPVKQHISHRAATFGTRTAVIQSAPGVKGQQQPIVRSVTTPMRTMTTTHRPTNPPIAPAGAHQSQNPTTVQITIHQPKHTLSSATAGSDRPAINTPHSVPTTHYGNPQAQIPLPVSGVSQQSLQRLVISQTPSGVIQQSRTTVPIPEQNRHITANAPNFTPLRKSGRPPGPIGQHDYTTSMRKPGPAEFGPIPSRPGVSIHTMADHKPPAMSGAFFSTTTTTTSSVVGGNYHPTTINSVDQHQGVFKTHNYNIPLSHTPTAAVPTIISTSCRSGPSGSPTVFMGADNSSQDSTAHSMSRPGVSPSILRKRTHDGSNAVVVKKLPGDRLVGYGERTLNSQPVSPARHHMSNTPLEKDNASQSSTDTAMSSESPIHTTVKPEPVEAIENGEREAHPPDVSPRKKPRKQLLNTAAQLKDRHDSSTEEETETKAELRLPVDTKMDFDFLSSAAIKDDFVDREGVRWVKMRERRNDTLLSSYRCTWNGTSSHFTRHSDIKVKEVSRPVVSELTNQKGIKQKASGWKFYHISSQIQDMIDVEQRLCERMSKLQKLLPAKLKERHSDLFKLNEIAQANKQRCSLTKDQLQEAKSSMFSILETHQPKIMEIIQKNHSKRPVKKKERS